MSFYKIDRIASTILGNLRIFATIFVVVYVPLSIGRGYWHRKAQWRVEQEAVLDQNVVQATLWLFKIDLIEAKAT